MFHNKKVLLVTPERLGDTLICTPAIHYLKSHYPSLQMDVLAFSELSAATLKNNPDIHHIFLLSDNIDFKQYDFALNIHGGSNLNVPLEQANLKVYTLPPIDYTRPQAEYALEFVKSLSPEQFEITHRHYRLFPDEEDRQYVKNLLASNGVDFHKDILIGCQLGCHGIAKKKGIFFRKKFTHDKVWPFDYFVELAKQFSAYNPHIRLVLTGSKSEIVLGDKFIKKIPTAISLIEKTNVLQLRALMDEMDLFITPDTGVMHVVCSADIPMVALFGPTNIARTGPYPALKDLTILRAKTMKKISVKMVFNTVIEKLKKN